MNAKPPDGGPPPSGWLPVWTHIRNRLFEGLLVILPVLVTFWIIHWLYSWLEAYIIEPLAVFVIWKVRNLRSAPELPAWFEAYAAPVLAVLIALAILYGCGVLAHSRTRRMLEHTLSRIPIVAPIYDAMRNVLKCLETSGGDAKPQRVVLVPFPHPGMRLPAIVTSTCRDIATGKVLLCVYVPTTPVPTSGFFLMLPEEEATELNWDVQQTLQAIISGGLTAPPEVTYYRPAPAAGSAAALCTAQMPSLCRTATGVDSPQAIQRHTTMLTRIRNAVLPTKSSSLAKAFTRLGWAGLWLQIIFGSFPILVMIYYFAFARPVGEPRGGLAFVEYLTIANLLFLLFTMFWSYRYTQIGKRLADPQTCPPQSQLVSIAWTGVLASAAGMMFSMLVLLLEAGKLLFHFLKAPQGGIPVVQTSGAGGVHFVTSVDMVSLMALILTLFAELLVLIFSLWLLFRATLGALELSPAVSVPEAKRPATGNAP